MPLCIFPRRSKTYYPNGKHLDYLDSEYVEHRTSFGWRSRKNSKDVNVEIKRVTKTFNDFDLSQIVDEEPRISDDATYEDGNRESLQRVESVDSMDNSTDGELDDEPKKKENLIRRRSGVVPKSVKFDEKAAQSLVKYPKTSSDEELIKNAISKNEFLSKIIRGKRLQEVVDAMYLRQVKAKEKIIKEGTTGSHMYVSAEGEFEVIIKGQGVVNVIGVGSVFGEIAILYNAKRLATVKASKPGKIWVIDREVYQQLVGKTNMEELGEVVSFLQNVPILNSVGFEVLKKVATLLKQEFYSTGKTIVQEGAEGDKFYIISAGSVSVKKEGDGFISQLYKGQCFGEIALLKKITRQATVLADAPGTECLTLSRKDFIDHFGSVEDISDLTLPPQSTIVIEEIEAEYPDLDLNECRKVATLGVGGFGRVEFIQNEKDPSQTFALKYLKKFFMVQLEQQQHVFNEKQIQMACKSPFIIRMYRTFKDTKYIFFLMEPCLGGDLWSWLQKQPGKKVNEKGAKFIAGCTLEALDYLHQRNVVYRDLKPENLLIDHKGYIKLTDFGFAKKLLPNAKTGTFAGTPEYVAPEIILSAGHDKSADFWSYGILIYEILNGKTPFRSNDPSHLRTYNNILNGLNATGLPTNMSVKAKNLVQKLLKNSPPERLGCLRGGIGEIREHPWFSKFDWDSLKKQKMSSQFKPNLRSNVDTSHIEMFPRDPDIPPDETSGWDEYI